MRPMSRFLAPDADTRPAQYGSLEAVVRTVLPPTVVAPVTASVPDSVVLPVTASVPPADIFPVTLRDAPESTC